MQTRISGCAYIKINDYLRICVGSGHSLQFSHHNSETQHTRESRVPCRSHEDIFKSLCMSQRLLVLQKILKFFSYYYY